MLVLYSQSIISVAKNLAEEKDTSSSYELLKSYKDSTIGLNSKFSEKIKSERDRKAITLLQQYGKISEDNEKIMEYFLLHNKDTSNWCVNIIQKNNEQAAETIIN